MIARGQRDVMASEDDLSGVAVQEPVGEVATERIGEVQSTFGLPAA
ncbi:hypothetical protein ACFW1M_41780 [Streptomyces inhibens]